ncbi:hypothetical protein [Desulfoferula mesophila]|uniref:Restriction system protein Mrr-like N-terminal domain-containing protein n=1 Tax=Desulfoferula mesophila TaxID=3058419 RepID=A0AAU9EP87_9BACT|nr:hypothetical protein FAK_27520 [Desulfoferula mesophilus]
MASKEDLADWLVEALRDLGGSAKIVPICEYVWKHHEYDLKESPKGLFFTWQYDIRWAAKNLRDRGVMKPAHISPNGVWELT